MITQDELKRELRYNPETGTFTRLVSRKGVRAGSEIFGAINSSGYAFIGIRGKLYRAHRLAFLYMTGEFPADNIDHLNGVRSDNRWENLRSVTQAENTRNSSISKKNTSGITGVLKQGRIWYAHISAAKKLFRFSFQTKEEAASARRSLERLCGYHTNHGRSTS